MCRCQVWSDQTSTRQSTNCKMDPFSSQRGPELHEVLKAVVKCVNFIKVRPLNQRLLASLCAEMDADHKALLWQNEVFVF